MPRPECCALLAANKQPHSTFVISLRFPAMAMGINYWTRKSPFFEATLKAGLDWMLEPEKGGDLIGKAALRRIKREGVGRRLVGIHLDGDPLPQGAFQYRWPAFHGGEKIGEVTDAVYSPRLKKNIGYAMVQSNFSALGATFVGEAPFDRTPATAVKKPFIARVSLDTA